MYFYPNPTPRQGKNVNICGKSKPNCSYYFRNSLPHRFPQQPPQKRNQVLRLKSSGCKSGAAFHLRLTPVPHRVGRPSCRQFQPRRRIQRPEREIPRLCPHSDNTPRACSALTEARPVQHQSGPDKAVGVNYPGEEFPHNCKCIGQKL